MHTILLVVHVSVCLFMILVILLQPSKEGGGMGGLGAGTSASAFGGRGSATFLSKVTTFCAAIFMLSALWLAYMSSKSESSVLKYAAPAPVSAPAKSGGPGTGSEKSAPTAAKPATGTAPAAPSAAKPVTPAPAAPSKAPAPPAPAHP